MNAVDAAPRRLLNGLVLSGTAVVAMIVGHCGGHQLDAWAGPAGGSAAGSAAPAAAVGGEHAHHLAGHLADASTGSATGVHAGHGALLPMASGAFLLAVTAGLVLLLAVRHRRRLTVAPVRTLLGAQLLAFVVLEGAQRRGAVEMWADALTDRRIWLALALQPAVAWVVHRLGRRAAAAVAELLAAPTAPQLPGLVPLGLVTAARVLGPAVGARTGALARGPPCERFHLT